MTDSLYRWSCAAVNPLLTDAALLAGMLRFEIALARAQGELGMIPHDAASAIARLARDFAPNPAASAREAALAGSPAIAFVKALTGHVAAYDAAAAAYVHFGATSQDVIDTALVLCLKQAVSAIDAALRRAQSAATSLTSRHADTAVLARTLMQPAGVTTIGFKTGQWTLSLLHARTRLARSAKEALAVSLGGAIGTLAAYGERGDALRAVLARELALLDPGADWHSRRETLTGLASDAGVAAGVMSKIARDLSLMMQAEVGEAQEPAAEGRGGSTAMPHKRNPVLCLRVLACAQPAPATVSSLLAGMAQEHERGLGNWQAELGQYQSLFEGVHGAAHALAELLEGVRFDAARCRANIEATGGAIFSEALAALLQPWLGREAAHRRVADLCVEAAAGGLTLGELAARQLPAEAGLEVNTEQIARVFDIDRAAECAGRQARALLATGAFCAGDPGTVN